MPFNFFLFMYYDMHMTHTAAIFDVHDDCDVRLNYVKKVLEDNGYETDIYLPDFDHYAKKYRTSLKPGIHYLHILFYNMDVACPMFGLIVTSIFAFFLEMDVIPPAVQFKLYPIWWTRIFAKVYAFGETISEPGHTFVC